MPPPVGFDAVPLVRPLVAAFGLVHEVIRRVRPLGCERTFQTGSRMMTGICLSVRSR